MTDIIVECRGGVIQEVTVIGNDARVFVLDWDGVQEKPPAKECTAWPVQRDIGSLTAETRELYDRSLGALHHSS